MTVCSLFSAVGPRLTHYGVDLESAQLRTGPTTSLSAKIQYACRHPRQPILYVVASDGASRGGGERHRLSALSIDPSGSTRLLGSEHHLPHRPIHVTVDSGGAFVLVAYNRPSQVSVHRLDGQGTIVEEVQQLCELDCGSYAHQVRLLPSNDAAVIVARGHNRSLFRRERPGSLHLFGFNDGRLTPLHSVAPNGGYGFGPRHLDFHPTRPWVYVALERQNQLWMFRLDGNRIAPTPLAAVSTLGNDAARPRQWVGAVHVHPAGPYVYVANRGHQDTIAVFRIDDQSGLPRLIQLEPTRAHHVRTFSLDPAGRILVAAGLCAGSSLDGRERRLVPMRLSIFGVDSDGHLTLRGTHDLGDGPEEQFWSGIV